MTNWVEAKWKADKTAKWAVTMTKVRIRHALSRTRWQLVKFLGPHKGESRGVVDLLAVRKDHGKPVTGTKRGDALQIILIQVKGGSSPIPTAEDGERLGVVARRVRAQKVLLSIWKKGSAAQLFRLSNRSSSPGKDWIEITDLNEIFR